MSEFLTPDDVQMLTGYTRKTEQRRELGVLGIKYIVNHTGRPIVLRASLPEKFGLRSTRPCTPDLDALEALENGPKT